MSRISANRKGGTAYISSRFADIMSALSQCAVALGITVNAVAWTKAARFPAGNDQTQNLSKRPPLRPGVSAESHESQRPRPRD